MEGVIYLIMQIMMVNIIISLLHMDDLPLDLTPFPPANSREPVDLSVSEGGNAMAVSFSGLILDILRLNLPSALDEENTMNGNVPADAQQALEWRLVNAKRFIEDWEWRLSVLQRLLPLSDRQWRWEEALTVLRAAPSKLLNL